MLLLSKSVDTFLVSFYKIKSLSLIICVFIQFGYPYEIKSLNIYGNLFCYCTKGPVDFE